MSYENLRQDSHRRPKNNQHQSHVALDVRRSSGDLEALHTPQLHVKSMLLKNQHAASHQHGADGGSEADHMYSDYNPDPHYLQQKGSKMTSAKNNKYQMLPQLKRRLKQGGAHGTDV